MEQGGRMEGEAGRRHPLTAAAAEELPAAAPSWTAGRVSEKRVGGLPPPPRRSLWEWTGLVVHQVERSWTAAGWSFGSDSAWRPAWG